MHYLYVNFEKRCIDILENHRNVSLTTSPCSGTLERYTACCRHQRFLPVYLAECKSGKPSAERKVLLSLSTLKKSTNASQITTFCIWDGGASHEATGKASMIYCIYGGIYRLLVSHVLWQCLESLVLLCSSILLRNLWDGKPILQ